MLRIRDVGKGWAISLVERLQELQKEYALEQDLGKKRNILEQILALIQAGWEQLFRSLWKEENPKQVLLLVADLHRVFEERRTQLEKPK